MNGTPPTKPGLHEIAPRPRRPIGVWITGGIYLALCIAMLAGFVTQLVKYRILDIRISAFEYAMSLLFPALFLCVAYGVFQLKELGRAAAVALTILIVVGGFFSLMMERRTDVNPQLARIDEIWMIFFSFGLFVCFLEPWLVLYFCLFDKATVAAFQKRPKNQ